MQLVEPATRESASFSDGTPKIDPRVRTSPFRSSLLLQTTTHMNSHQNAAKMPGGGSPRAHRYHPGRVKWKEDPFRGAGFSQGQSSKPAMRMGRIKPWGREDRGDRAFQKREGGALYTFQQTPLLTHSGHRYLACKGSRTRVWKTSTS